MTPRNNAQTKQSRKAKKRIRSKGQSLLEFGMAFPLLMMLVIGVMEMGRLIYIYSAVTTASREGARYGFSLGQTPGGVPYYEDCDGIREAARASTSIAGISTADIHIHFDNGPGTEIASYCPPTSVEHGTRIVVSVSSTFDAIVPLLPIPSFEISSTAKRSIVAVDVNPGWK
jgi:hypothetical protein